MIWEFKHLQLYSQWHNAINWAALTQGEEKKKSLVFSLHTENLIFYANISKSCQTMPNYCNLTSNQSVRGELGTMTWDECHRVNETEKSNENFTGNRRKLFRIERNVHCELSYERIPMGSWLGSARHSSDLLLKLCGE